MNKKTKKIIYYVGTIMLTAVMCFSVSMYLTKTEMIRNVFESYSYPRYVVYPLAIAKILGLLAIWTNINRSLKEWAYAGFFFNLVMALTVHFKVDGGYQFASVAMVGLILSYIGWEKESNPSL